MDPVALVEEHIALARSCARKMWWRTVEEFDDVYADALLGLWDAAQRHDPARSAFPTFAWRRMTGAIGDGRRERDWVSRSVRRRGDVVAPLSIDYVLVSSGRDGSHDLTLADRLADPSDQLGEVDDAAGEWDRHVRLAAMIEELPSDDRYVVRRLLDGATLAQIGDEMGFSESRACQIHRRAVDRLRNAASRVA